MANSTIKNYGGRIAQNRVTISLANATIQTIAGGGIELYQLDENNFIAFISLAIKYSSSRGANMASWKLQLDGVDLKVGNPYFISCLIDGSNTPYFSYSAENKPYFNNPTALSANQVMRCSGVVHYSK